MKTGTVRWGKAIGFAGAFIAFLIGSGFATGQEILQYFTSYGYQGIFVVIAMLLLFVYVGGSFITAGFTQQFDKGSDIFTYYCGKYVGAFYDYFTIAFVFMSYVVMVAGAGATLNQHYALPVWVGGVLMMVLACGTVLMGLGKIVDIIGMIGPVIVIISIGLGLFAIISNFSEISDNAAIISAGTVTEAGVELDLVYEATTNNETETLPVVMKRAGTSWFTSASSYVGFCMLWLAAFLAAMGKGAKSKKEARIGSTLGAIGFSAGCAVLMFGLIAYLPDIAMSEIPSLVLAGKVHGSVATLFTVIIIAGIFTTAVPLLWQVSSRFTKEGTTKFRVVTVVLAAAGCFVGLMLPFSELVGIIYVINGYVGILLLVFIIVKDVRVFIANKKAKITTK